MPLLKLHSLCFRLEEMPYETDICQGDQGKDNSNKAGHCTVAAAEQQDRQSSCKRKQGQHAEIREME